MTKQPLKLRLYEYLKKHEGEYIASGAIQRLVSEKTTYTPQTTGRELRTLCEEGKIEVEYRAKRHAWYRVPKAPQTPLRTHYSPSQTPSRTVTLWNV